jgi:uncharacterized protein YjiS (DUF1127 family)
MFAITRQGAFGNIAQAKVIPLRPVRRLRAAVEHLSRLVADHVADHVRERRDRRLLERMSTRERRDIGLRRLDVPRAAPRR